MGIVQDLCNCDDTDRPEPRWCDEEQSPNNDDEKESLIQSEDKLVFPLNSTKRGSASSKYENDDDGDDDDEDTKESKQDPPSTQIAKLRINKNMESIPELQQLPAASPLFTPTDSANTMYMKRQIYATQKRESVTRESLSWINGLYERNYAEGVKNWNKTSLEWFNRMEELYEFANNIKVSTRTYIWYSFDKQKIDRLGTKLFIPKLIYSYIVLLIKSIDKQAMPPKFKQLKSVLKFYTLEMIQLMPMEQKDEMTKIHYDMCFIVYLKNIMDKRSHLIPQ